MSSCPVKWTAASVAQDSRNKFRIGRGVPPNRHHDEFPNHHSSAEQITGRKRSSIADNSKSRADVAVWEHGETATIRMKWRVGKKRKSL